LDAAMAYRIRSSASIEDNVRKIACEQIDRAIAEITDSKHDRHEVVHQVRKRCKKLRGLIRLVRPDFEAYARENALLREAARRLSYVRDAQSMIDCFDSLMAHSGVQADRERFSPIRAALADRRREITQDKTQLEARLNDFLGEMRELLPRAARWQIDAHGFEAVQGGLVKTYRRGRKALRNAYEHPATTSFHEWRKRTKYHWYHLRLLRSIWPEMMQVQRDAANALSGLLGEDHDLAVLRQTLQEDPGRFGDMADRKTLIGLIERRRAELQAQAQPLGERLFAEKPNRLASRLRCYWNTWD
jgi:hypothetical protein